MAFYSNLEEGLWDPDHVKIQLLMQTEPQSVFSKQH